MRPRRRSSIWPGTFWNSPPDSERRRGAGADQLARVVFRIAKPVRKLTVEQIRLSRPEDASLLGDRHFQAARHDHAALLALMHQGHAAGVGVRLIVLLEDLQVASRT